MVCLLKKKKFKLTGTSKDIHILESVDYSELYNYQEISNHIWMNATWKKFSPLQTEHNLAYQIKCWNLSKFRECWILLKL